MLINTITGPEILLVLVSGFLALSNMVLIILLLIEKSKNQKK